MPDPGEMMHRSEIRRVALALLAIHNIIQNTFLRHRGYVTGNLVVSAALIGIGRVSHVAPSEMGLSLKIEGRDLRTAGYVAAMFASGSIVALAHPISRELLRDERARDSSGGIIAYKSLIRFPIGTALFEELAFRGVLPALSSRSDAKGDLLSAGAFGLWHLLPTARALGGNPWSTEMSLIDRMRTVIAGSAATTLAGLGFSLLRRRSGTIALPWLVHSAFNSLTYLAGVLAWRLSDGQA